MPPSKPTGTNVPARFAPYKDIGFRRPTSDPLVHCGRYFGRTTDMYCKVEVLLKNGSLRLKESATNQTEKDVDVVEPRDQRIFHALLEMIPDLRNRLTCASDKEIVEMAEKIQKGVDGARSDDTKAIKHAIIGWITPDGTQTPIELSSMTSRGFRHEWTGALLCPSCRDWSDPSTKDVLRNADRLNHPLSVQDREAWPLFLYADGEYDPANVWQGLFKGALLVKGFRHIFFSPSSANKGIGQSKSTRAGQAQIHGMNEVRPASIAYVATQIKFGLSSAKVLSPNLRRLEYEPFYERILNFLTSAEEKDKVNELLAWWNRLMFPPRLYSKNSFLELIKIARRRKFEAAAKLLDDSGSCTHESTSEGSCSSNTNPEA